MNRALILAGGLVWILPSLYANEATEKYIENWKITAIEQMNAFAIPASITLAQGILESASGTSKLAQHANNHFGIKCHKNWDGSTFIMDDDAKNECFRSYAKADKSYEDHSVFLSSRSRYDFLFGYKTTDYKSWAKGLKKAGYATNPKYADLLIDIVERYGLDQYDKMGNLPSKSRDDDFSFTAGSGSSTVLTNQPQKENEVKRTADVNVHEVQKNRWNVRYVVVQQGDTYYRIANEFKLGMWQLYKYNDLGKRDVLHEGEIIYLDPKKNKASRGYTVFVCSKETTLRKISQEEGLKLKKLMKLNYIFDPDKKLPTGTKVILR